MKIYVVVGYSVISDAFELVGVFMSKEKAKENLEEKDEASEWYMDYELIESELDVETV